MPFWLDFLSTSGVIKQFPDVLVDNADLCWVQNVGTTLCGGCENPLPSVGSDRKYPAFSGTRNPPCYPLNALWRKVGGRQHGEGFLSVVDKFVQIKQ